MGRETDDEREDRLKRAGAWLVAELKKRDWSQRYLAGQLGVSQQQVSAYVLGRHQFDPGLVPDLARLLTMEEEEVWRSLRIPLPSSFRSDDALVAYALEHFPNSMAARHEDESGPKERNPRSEKPPRPRTGESDGIASPDAENAV